MLGKIALLMASLLFALFLAEMVFRLNLAPEPAYVVSSEWWKDRWLRKRKGKNPKEFVELDRELGWIPAAELDDHPYQGAHISTNSANMRGAREYTLERTGAPRIVTVGDSYTFGQCVNDDEVYGGVLEELLPGSEVLNLGVMGYGQDQALIRLRREGLPYRPDVVVFGFHGSNMRRNLLSFRDYAKPRMRLVDGELVTENVPLPTPMQVILDPWPPRMWDYYVMAGQKDILKRPEVREEMEALSEAIVHQMAADAAEVGARLAVIHLPHPAWLKGDDPFGLPIIKRLCEGENPSNLICPTALDRFREIVVDKQTQSIHYECHFSPQLQRAVGEAIVESLREEMPEVFGPAPAPEVATAG